MPSKFTPAQGIFRLQMQLYLDKERGCTLMLHDTAFPNHFYPIIAMAVSPEHLQTRWQTWVHILLTNTSHKIPRHSPACWTLLWPSLWHGIEWLGAERSCWSVIAFEAVNHGHVIPEQQDWLSSKSLKISISAHQWHCMTCFDKSFYLSSINWKQLNCKLQSSLPFLQSLFVN